MVYFRALSGARRDRLQTPDKSAGADDACAMATPGLAA